MPAEPTLAFGDGQSSDEMFSGISALVRESGRTAAFATVVLVMILVSVVSRLLSGAEVTFAGLVLAVPMAATFVASAALAARSRQTLVRGLADMRARTGAPVDTRAPWTSLGVSAPLGEHALQQEARRLIGAAWLCGELAWRALRWAVATGLIFIFWMVATV